MAAGSPTCGPAAPSPPGAAVTPCTTVVPAGRSSSGSDNRPPAQSPLLFGTPGMASPAGAPALVRTGDSDTVDNSASSALLDIGSAGVLPLTGSGGGVNHGKVPATARDCSSIRVITRTACWWAELAWSLLAFTSISPTSKPAMPPAAKPSRRIACQSKSTGSGMAALASAMICACSPTRWPRSAAVSPATSLQSASVRIASRADSAASPCQPSSPAARRSRINCAESAISTPNSSHSFASAPAWPGSLSTCTDSYSVRWSYAAQFQVWVGTTSRLGPTTPTRPSAGTFCCAIRLSTSHWSGLLGRGVTSRGWPGSASGTRAWSGRSTRPAKRR